jgi:sulfide:quinone oxidoreductase
MNPLRVVIVGSGVAGLEALLALEELAGDRVDVTVVSPQTGYRVRALATRAPFGEGTSPQWSIPGLCHRHGARFVQGTIRAIHADEHAVELDRGRRLPYDALLVTTGASSERTIPGGSLFTDGPAEVERVHGLVLDVEGGWTSHVAFVVPPGLTWSLPAYELAFLLAERARAMCVEGVEMCIVTGEGRPLEVFGPESADIVERALTESGIRLVTDADVAEVDGRAVVGHDGETIVRAQRVIVLGAMHGRAPRGLPTDADGFVPVDACGAVIGVPDVWAAGDGTDEPLKLGAVAAQRATEAARVIARRAGADIPAPLAEPAPVAILITGTGTIALGGPDGPVASPSRLAAAAKVAAPRLRRALGGTAIDAH